MKKNLFVITCLLVLINIVQAKNVVYSNNTNYAAILPPPTCPTITVNSNTLCAGQTASFTAIGGTSYDFIVNGLIVQSGASSTYASNSLTNGALVSVIETSGTGGCVNSNTITIAIAPTPTLVLTSSTPSVCSGFSAILIASGLTTYTWSTGGTGSVLSVNPTLPTTYSVNATNTFGCVTSGNISIGILPPSLITINSSALASCSGAPVTLNASGALTYTWNTGAQTTSISVAPAVATTYTVTGNNGSGCVTSKTFTVPIGVNPTINAGADAEVKIGDSYQLNPTQTGATSYTWSPADFLSSTIIINPTSTPLNDVTYVLTASSANGCFASDTIKIKVNVIVDLVIANYMSPNADGNNDTWNVNAPALIKNYSVEIIDSYGQTVYSKADNYNNEFDGKKSGQYLPDGVYYYFIKEGSVVNYKGSITLTK